MKRYLINLLVMTAAVIAVSCTKVDNPAFAGMDAEVAFSISTSEISTRAYGDGTSATSLYYGVYTVDEQNTFTLVEDLSKTNESVSINGQANINIKLVNGRKYSVVFFAKAASGSVCSVDWSTLKMTYSPTTANQESYDAFYAYVEPFEVTGAIQKNVSLKRPFAQLNIGTSDDYAVSDIAVTISSSNNTLDLKSGEVSYTGEAEATGITYAKNGTPTNETFPKDGYKYLSMNYILVGAEPEVADITMSVNDGTYTREFKNVPLRRNYRTNIYGPLFTVNGDFGLDIENGFESPDNEVEGEVVVADTPDAANEAFENGATSVKIESVTEATTISLPQVQESTAIILPETEAEVTIKYPENATEVPAELNISIPEGSVENIILNVPNTTVYINGQLTSLSAATADNTLYVKAGANIGSLEIIKGNVVIENGGVVTNISRSQDNTDDETVVYYESDVTAPTTSDPKIKCVPVVTVSTAAEFKTAMEGANTVVRIKLANDITVNSIATVNATSNITLDMNGYDLSYTVSTASASEIIKNFGTLKIVSASEATFSYKAENPDTQAIPSYATNTITNSGNGHLTVCENVVVTNGSNGGASYAVDVQSGTFILDGAILKGNRCALRVARFNADTKFTMNNGIVEALTPAWIHLPGSKSTDAPAIDVEIKGGTFQSTKDPSSADNNVLYTYSYGNSHANTKVTISGGEFLGGTVSIGSGYKGDAPTLIITGGKFEYDVMQWKENDESTVLYQKNM